MTDRRGGKWIALGSAVVARMWERERHLNAAADFIDWLCDHGYVLAKRDDARSWTPITEADGERIGLAYMEEHKP